MLIALVYYLANSPMAFWPAWETMRSCIVPLISGFVVGLILGDPVTGTIMGATINLMYIGFISAGGSMPSDMSLAGILGTALAIIGGITPEAALAIAVPLGLLGSIVWVGKMTICTAVCTPGKKVFRGGKTGKKSGSSIFCCLRFYCS